jgi:thiosulfate dehydrogenase (quinone) large subunit
MELRGDGVAPSGGGDFMALKRVDPASPADFREPAVARFLFADVRAGRVWLFVRLYLAMQWLGGGFEKLVSPDWTGDRAGAGLGNFIESTLGLAGAQHRQVEGWYAALLRDVVLPHAAAVGQVVTIAEIAIGLCLLLGAFTGIAAAAGIVLNSSYALAGAIGIDPLMILLEVLIVVAWRTAGWVGLDRRLLPAIGTPWQPGTRFARRPAARSLPADSVVADHHRLSL